MWIFESWREQSLAVFAPPGLFPEEEGDEYGIANPRERATRKPQLMLDRCSVAQR
jgi:hypothetical protein